MNIKYEKVSAERLQRADYYARALTWYETSGESNFGLGTAMLMNAKRSKK